MTKNPEISWTQNPEQPWPEWSIPRVSSASLPRISQDDWRWSGSLTSNTQSEGCGDESENSAVQGCTVYTEWTVQCCTAGLSHTVARRDITPVSVRQSSGEDRDLWTTTMSTYLQWELRTANIGIVLFAWCQWSQIVQWDLLPYQVNITPSLVKTELISIPETSPGVWSPAPAKFAWYYLDRNCNDDTNCRLWAFLEAKSIEVKFGGKERIYLQLDCGWNKVYQKLLLSRHSFGVVRTVFNI